MDTIFSIAKTIILGFVGFIALLFVLAVVFGKRVIKQWEYEAEFRDETGREFGEFDVEMSRLAKTEPDFTLKTKFRMRNAALIAGASVEVWIDDTLVLAGPVANAGRVNFNNDNLVTPVTTVRAGQMCRIVCNGDERFKAALVKD